MTKHEEAVRASVEGALIWDSTPEVSVRSITSCDDGFDITITTWGFECTIAGLVDGWGELCIGESWDYEPCDSLEELYVILFAKACGALSDHTRARAPSA